MLLNAYCEQNQLVHRQKSKFQILCIGIKLIGRDVIHHVLSTIKYFP
jgi:hypothetical protein